jgi:hypothetical protein
MKHNFIVNALVAPFQKFVFGFSAFGLAWIFSWLILDIVERHHDAESIVLAVFLVVLTILISICCLLCLFGYYGIEVDMKKSTCRQYIGLLGLKYGKAEPLPANPEYILVFESIKPEMLEMEMGTYEVSIVHGDKFRKVFLQSQSRRGAAAVAQKLSEIFHLEVINKTLNEP